MHIKFIYIKHFMIIFAFVWLTACGGGGHEGLPQEQQIASSHIVNYVNNSAEPPKAVDYKALGIGGVTEENIDSINTLVKDLSIVDVVSITEAIEAWRTIVQYAQTDGGSKKPTEIDYKRMGVIGVNTSNIDTLNTLIARSVPFAVDCQKEIQSIVESISLVAPDPTPTYTLAYTAGTHGALSGSTSQTVTQGANGTAVTATADTGYHFTSWSDGSTQNPRTDSNIQADLSVTANFAANPTVSTAKATYNPNETVSADVAGSLSGDKDWVGIYPADANNSWSNVIAWNWTTGGTVVLSRDKKPMPAGAYEVRLFYHNSTSSVEARYRFTVADNDYASLGNYNPVAYDNGKTGDQKYIAYYPENGISVDMPVVMFIKGGGSATIESYSGIMQFLASKGYFVIGVDTNSYASWYITGKLEIALNEVKASYGLNVSKLAIMGHSLGGGQAFYVIKKFRDDGYGDAGSLALSIDGWFAFNMDEVDMNLLDSKVSFLQMNGINGTGTDPRIHLKIWNLATQANRSFYTLPSANHSYVAGDLASILGKDDLRFIIGALTYDAFHGTDEGARSIPTNNKATYNDIFDALEAEDAYDGGDCAGIQYNAIDIIAHNDIDYCNLSATVKKYPALTTMAERATDDSVARPTVGNPTIDPVYSTIIKMVDKPDHYTSSYPKVQNWNADMRLMRIGNRIYDAKTLSESNITKNKTNTEGYHALCSRASDYFRWSNRVPHRFYVLNSSHAFIQGKITGNDVNCSTVLDAFSEYEVVHMGPHEGNIDYDDRYVVFVAKKPNDTTFYVILYDIQNKTRVWTKTMPGQNWEWVTENGSSFWKPTTLDWLSVSPSGKYIVFNNDNAAASGYTDGMYRYDMNLTNRVKLQYDWHGDLYSEGGHGDMGYDTEGNEVFVQFLSGLGVYSFNLDNPTELGKELLDSPYGGGHISCRNTRRLGWCYVTANTDSNGNGIKRVFTLRLDGGGAENIENFSQTHIDTGYHDTYGSPSPDGTRVIFNSHWGMGSVDTFVSKAQ